jgi:hypothetical protein
MLTFIPAMTRPPDSQNAMKYDPAVETLLAQRFRGLGAGQAAASDDECA